MAQLPLIQDPNQNLMLLQTRWRSQLNPILANPILNGHQISNVALIVGSTNISHGLGRMQQGWFITDKNAAGSIYRSQAVPFNMTTLNLSASAVITISLWVY